MAALWLPSVNSAIAALALAVADDGGTTDAMRGGDGGRGVFLMSVTLRLINFARLSAETFGVCNRLLLPVVKPAPDVAHLVRRQVAPAKLVRVYPVHCRRFI